MSSVLTTQPKQTNLPVTESNYTSMVNYVQQQNQQFQAQPVPAEPTMPLREMLGILYRRKFIILLTLLMTISLAIFYTVSSKDIYKATAIVQIEKEGAQIVSFGKTSAGSVYTDSNDPTFKTTYELLKNRVLAQKVIDELNLKPILVPPTSNKSSSPLKDTIKEFIGLKPKNSASNQPAAINYSKLFLNNLFVQAMPGTHLVNVSYKAPTAILSKQVLDSLLRNFITLQIQSKSETGKYAKDFLSKQLAESRKKLLESERALVAYSNKNGILGVDDRQTRQVQKLVNLDRALVDAEIRRNQAESLYKEMKRVGNVNNVLSSAVITSLKASLVRLEGNYQEMLKTFRPNYPDMVRLKQQIDNVRVKLNQEKSSIKQSLEADYFAAREQENRIRRELKKFNNQMHRLQKNSVDYNTLKRAVDTNGQLYNSLLKRLEEVNVASAADTSSITIIEPPELPYKRYKPQPVINLIVGILSGLILGLAFAFLREALDNSIRSVEDIEKITGLPVLGSIPKISSLAVKKQLKAINSGKKPPQSPAIEAFRITSTNIRFMSKANDQHVLLITSAQPQEGKSTTAINMAYAYAQMGMKVLVVDADIRNASLHEHLNLSNKRGLTHYLKGEIDLVGITQPIKPVAGLYAITAGSFDTDPITLLSHERMAYLTTQGASIFDYVIIDAPPVTGFADTLILSSLASSTIIVAKESTMDSSSLKKVLNQLGRVTHNVLGFLVIGVKKPSVKPKYYAKSNKKMRKRVKQQKLLTS